MYKKHAAAGFVCADVGTAVCKTSKGSSLPDRVSGFPCPVMPVGIESCGAVVGGLLVSVVSLFSEVIGFVEGSVLVFRVFEFRVVDVQIFSPQQVWSVFIKHCNPQTYLCGQHLCDIVSLVFILEPRGLNRSLSILTQFSGKTRHR